MQFCLGRTNFVFRPCPDSTLKWLKQWQLPSVSFQVGERFFEVGDEIVSGVGLDDHIVDVSFDVAAYLLVKTHLDGPLVGRPGVFESEGHGGVAIRTERHDERCLDLVVLLEGYLVVARVIVEEGEQFTASGGVYNLVYLRQTKGVFRAVFVEIGVINAHSPFFFLTRIELANHFG